MTKFVVPVVASLFDLEFTIGSSTGTDQDSRPGIGVALVPNAAGERLATPTELALLRELRPGGVIGREAAAMLRDELEIFLKNRASGANA